MKAWKCNACGVHPENTSRWCQHGCGSDYNRMDEVEGRWNVVAVLCTNCERVTKDKYRCVLGCTTEKRRLFVWEPSA